MFVGINTIALLNIVLLSTSMIALTCNNKINSKRSIKDIESCSIKSLLKNITLRCPATLDYSIVN